MNTEKLIRRCRVAEEFEKRTTELSVSLDKGKPRSAVHAMERVIAQFQDPQTPLSDEGRAAIKETFLIHLRSLEHGLTDALDQEYSADRHKLDAINLMLEEK